MGSVSPAVREFPIQPCWTRLSYCGLRPARRQAAFLIVGSAFGKADQPGSARKHRLNPLVRRKGVQLWTEGQVWKRSKSKLTVDVCLRKRTRPQR